MKRFTTRFWTPVLSAAVIFAVSWGVIALKAEAQSQPTTGFALQVTPSPLVATLKPGEATTLELAIRNTATESQDLKMGLRSFTVDESSGQVNLGQTEPTDVASFVSFERPTFTLQPGEILTQKITAQTPREAAFTYSFAIIIGRQAPVKPTGSTTAIEGSVAVFTLLNVDRQGAERKFELNELKISKKMYEYLPADFSVKLKNTGNTLVQPKGTVFIQRGSDDVEPIATIPLNPNNGYLLPNTSRVFASSWSDGFPHYESKTDENGKQQRKLIWNWGDLSKLRIGKYTAKVVAVYDDGQRDVPITTEVTFWVFPWRLFLGIVVVLLLVVVGLIVTLRHSARAIKRRKPHKTDVQD